MNTSLLPTTQVLSAEYCHLKHHQWLETPDVKHINLILAGPSSPVNLRWKWPNLEQIATEGFFALTG